MKISTITLQKISEKKSNDNRKVVSPSDFVLWNRNPTTSELDQIDLTKTFFATEEFRFFKTKDKNIIFQRCFKSFHGEILWDEIRKPFLVEEGEVE